jgi:hypothetical protein
VSQAQSYANRQVNLETKKKTNPTKRQQETVIKELNFDSFDNFESALGKVHKGLDMVLGKQSKDLSTLINQIYHIKSFWQKKRPNVTIKTMADLVNDIKGYTESIQSQKVALERDFTSLTERNEQLQASLLSLQQEDSLKLEQESEKATQISSLITELDQAQTSNKKLHTDLLELNSEKERITQLMRDALQDTENVTDTEGSIMDMIEKAANELKHVHDKESELLEMIAQVEGANEQLKSDLEDQRVQLSMKEQEIQSLNERQQDEALEVENHYAQVEGLVQKIEEAELRMKEQANLCSTLQGQISHLNEQNNSKVRVKHEEEDMQEQWQQEREFLQQQIQELQLKCESQQSFGDSRDFLSALSCSFRENLLYLFHLLDDPELLKDNQELVFCLAKIRDDMFDMYSEESHIPSQAQMYNSPSTRTFTEKVEYFNEVENNDQREESARTTPGLNSPQIIEGIKARMNVDQKRQAKLSVELGEKIGEATGALKDEFEKHITSYKTRIEQLEQELDTKTELLHQQAAAGASECQNLPMHQEGEEVYDMSLFPEEWENQLLNIITQSALCPECEWGDMLASKEKMIRHNHKCHVRSLMERLKFDFHDEVCQLKESISTLERDLKNWTFVPEQSPLDLEGRVILQQRIIRSMHRLQVLNQLASLNGMLVKSSDVVASNISCKIGQVSSSDMTEAKVDRIIYESWCHALNEMKSISEELADVDIYHYSQQTQEEGSSRDRHSSSNTESTSRMDDALQIMKCAVRQQSKSRVINTKKLQNETTKLLERRNALSTIPRGGSFMNFSPGQPFLPGEREANLKMGQPPLKDILGPKSPTDQDIQELVKELLDHFVEDSEICQLIHTIKPCKEKHLSGSYKFGTKNIKLVILNDLLMVRIGGGFETFEQYFTKHFRLESFRLMKQMHNA